MLIRDEQDPYRYAEVRGRVMRTTADDRARAQVDELAHRYLGKDYPPEAIKSPRVALWITPGGQAVIDQNDGVAGRPGRTPCSNQAPDRCRAMGGAAWVRWPKVVAPGDDLYPHGDQQRWKGSSFLEKGTNMSEQWHRSTRSGSVGNCVEVACSAGATLIRDSKQPHGALLRVSPERWRGFLNSIGSGRWDSRKS